MLQLFTNNSFVAFCAGNQEGHFRLVNGSSSNEGRVEVCMNGGWRPVSGSGQNDTALAASVCSALGYSEEGKVIISHAKPVTFCISITNYRSSNRQL